MCFISLYVPTSGNQEDLTAVENIVLSIYEDGKHRSSVCWGGKSAWCPIQEDSHTASCRLVQFERETENGCVFSREDH